MHLFLVDAIGPFFRGCDRHNINWSKIPFSNLERNGTLDPDKQRSVEEAFVRFVHTVSAMGFNAITLDDVAHLYCHPAYPASLRAKIANYRTWYRRLFRIARAHGLRILLTTDIMFYHPSTARLLGRNERKIAAFLREAFVQLFEQFPEVEGVILRIGESDGLDVEGDFHSRLVIQTPTQARSYVEQLLPVFERYRRLMVFRTWSVGIYKVGDLIWNRHTFAETFGGLDSEQLIISLKYGESDFFRFLPLNKLFYYTDHKKIIELQARREYEGFGEYPSFVGWDYESYARQLARARNVVGAWVWCQTGGWAPFRRLTFLDDSSIWNEINTYVTLRIVKDRWTTEQAVEAFCKERLDHRKWRHLLQLLRLSDEVVKELLYIEEFSRRKIFFRRLRVPPLIWAYWNHILINHALRKILRIYVWDGEREVTRARAALDKIGNMIELVEHLGIPSEGLRFQYDTFEILAAAREYFFQPFSEAIVERLSRLKKAYEARYTTRYFIHVNFRRARIQRSHLRLILALLLRYQRGYRLLDKLFTLRMMMLIHPFMRLWHRRWVPEFARRQAMGLDAVFR